MLGDPGHRKDAPPHQHDHGRRAGGYDGLDQLLLRAGELQTGGVAELAHRRGGRQPRATAHEDQGHLSTLGCRHCCLDVALFGVLHVAAPSIAHLVVAQHGSEGRQRCDVWRIVRPDVERSSHLGRGLVTSLGRIQVDAKSGHCLAYLGSGPVGFPTRQRIPWLEDDLHMGGIVIVALQQSPVVGRRADHGHGPNFWR